MCWVQRVVGMALRYDELRGEDERHPIFVVGLVAPVCLSVCVCVCEREIGVTLRLVLCIPAVQANAHRIGTIRHTEQFRRHEERVIAMRQARTPNGKPV